LWSFKLPLLLLAFIIFGAKFDEVAFYDLGLNPTAFENIICFFALPSVLPPSSPPPSLSFDLCVTLTSMSGFFVGD
jgi:hypothetical protein